MIDLADARLQQTLLTIERQVLEQVPLGDSLGTSAMLDAWSLVDSIHRLADLAERMPNVQDKKHIPGFVLLRKNTVLINDLRNFIQHLSEKIQKVTVDSPTWSVWGALSWCSVNPETGDCNISTFLCGKAFKGAVRNLVNPLGKTIRLPIGLITLTQDTVEVCLSDLMTDVDRFAAMMEDMVGHTYQSNPGLTERYAADVVIGIKCELKKPEPASESN